MNNKSDTISRKFIQSYNIEDYEIFTDTGWQSISQIHKTEKYQQYSIETQTGKKLSGADNHIVFDENYNEIFLKDLTINHKIITQNGKQKINKVINNHISKNMYDITVNSKNHRYYTNGILSHNSTTYSIYILWYVLTNKDKHVLICANKLDTAIEILQRIQMAYQELPMWLKPGIITWNKKKIEFSNGCSVTATATSESSGRGLSINLLVLDEFGFISPGIEQAFMASVFPIISSSKNSKIIIVSTPNGMNNQFYRLWSKALTDESTNNKSDAAWHPTKIHWSDFPGRDQKWKEIQLATMNHNMIRWNQEFECKFLGSVVTLIDAKKIEQFKNELINKINIKQPYEIQLHKAFPDIKINMYMPPQQNHAYIIGADPSTGDGGDYHAMTIWDITNMYNIQLVADFYSNKLPPKQFAYLLAKSGFLYNCAYIAIENNGVSYAAIENLMGDFEYENIIHMGGNPKTSIAIHSTYQLKLNACLTAKEFIEDPLRKIFIYNNEIINEMQRFEKRSKSGKEPTYGCFNGHDDLMMSLIWAFYCLKYDIIDNYYNVRKYATNKLGNTVPLIITSDENSSDQQVKEIINNLDNKFLDISSLSQVQLTQSIQNQQEYLMNNFMTNTMGYNQSNIHQNSRQDEFDFGGFIS